MKYRNKTIAVLIIMGLLVSGCGQKKEETDTENSIV